MLTYLCVSYMQTDTDNTLKALIISQPLAKIRAAYKVRFLMGRSFYLVRTLNTVSIDQVTRCLPRCHLRGIR